MRLYGEIFKKADGEIYPSPKCLIVPNGNGYFEGVKQVGEFSPQRIDVYFRGVCVRVDGEFLCIKKYCDGDLEVGGKIISVSVVNGGG